MFLKKALAASILTTPILILSGCGGGTDASASNENKTAALTVALTDGPVDSAVAVVVEITGLAIKPAEGDVIEVTFDSPRSINLLELQGSAATDLINELALEPGEYDWVRVNINAVEDGVMDSYIEFEDGTSVELDMPGDAQGGLKIARHFTLIEGEEGVFTIDFDLRKSLFHRKDRPSTERSTTMLRPSLRMVPNHRAGHLRGDLDAMLVADLCAESATSLGAVYVFGGADATLADVNGSETDPVASALVKINDEGEYHYHIGFLEAGDYSVAYTCDAASDNPDEVNELTFATLDPISIEAREERKSHFNMDAPRREWNSRICDIAEETPEMPAAPSEEDASTEAPASDDTTANKSRLSYQHLMNWCASEDHQWIPRPGKYTDEIPAEITDREYPEIDKEYPAHEEGEAPYWPTRPIDGEWDKERPGTDDAKRDESEEEAEQDEDTTETTEA
ncbi:DUF4382 domain-containing protein [Marinagarivorans cellulosilyticus]|uniref:DUF4382 domain-containing protein n=1 Tax=Marinagarivorans cellulosilyticus TaxID=2721545 RepID=A0AAN2BIS6_9GAMM|nr:DUF4382 domain-containing protein [Marinagarivorans cellulosilyticus]BCD96227.1 hypothetical protein MARGE09_P0426 [Marinagarivorans cellulosilyticus]